jgi:cephalosporin-C deacetylase
MNSFSCVSFVLGVAALLWAAEPLPAMNVNLARSYDSEPSPPRVEGVSFYAPGADDFMFSPGGGAPVIVCLPHKRAMRFAWSLHHNLVKAPLLAGSVDPRLDNSGSIDLPLDSLPPGFYDLRVKVILSRDKSVDAVTTFGWRADEMPVHRVEPPDFDAFWKTAVTSLDTIPPKPELKLEQVLRGPMIDAYNLTFAALPENYDPADARHNEVEVYRVSFTGHAGQTVHGWYAKPVGDGPFPTLLVLPGAGNNARPAPVEHARHGYAALDIQVHGNPVDAPAYEPVGDDTSRDPLQRIHYSVYLNALQGARVARTLPGADANRFAVLGGSQGGRLTTVVAALDPHVRAAIPCITHYAYRPWNRWVAKLNFDGKNGAEHFAGETPSPRINPSDAYFDVANFAVRVKTPVLMNMGLTDPISPAACVYSVYLGLAGPKEIVPLPNTAHDWSPAFDHGAWTWLDARLRLAD